MWPVILKIELIIYLHATDPSIQGPAEGCEEEPEEVLGPVQPEGQAQQGKELVEKRKAIMADFEVFKRLDNTMSLV